MKFGFAVPAYGANTDAERLRDLLVAADELGFHSVWFPDHIAVPDYAAEVLSPPVLEPLSACAWGLGFTTNLRFGVDVLVAPYRHPLVVAAMTGTLERLSGDRFILGVGIGYLRGEFEVLGAGPYDRRAQITEDFLRAQRRAPDGYSLMSGTSQVPLWVGGNTSAAQRRAALLGDGWHPLTMPDTTYAEARRRMLEIRERESLTRPFTFSYSSGATEVLEQARSDWPTPRLRAPRESEFHYAPAPWVDEEDNRPRLVGTPDQVVSDLRLLEAAGVDHVTLRFHSVEVGDLERFASEVRPAFVS